MKRLVITFLFVLSLTTLACAEDAASAYVPGPEKLNYKVMYKWGLISKQAGTVKIYTHSFDNGWFSSTLIGQSASWADKFYSVRDTLRCTIMADKLEPTYYEKIAREGGDYKRDVINYTRWRDEVTGFCQRWRQKKKSDTETYSHITIKGTGVTLDMLSSYYYMRHIDYPNMKKGDTVTTNVFSGKKKEILNIIYLGQKSIEIDGKDHLCYYIKFTFTGDNGKQSSDDMYAWISTDSNRIPLMLLGNLPIGSIRCYYMP